MLTAARLLLYKVELGFPIITSEQSERSSYYQSYMGRLDDIQTALKPLKKWEKTEIPFYDPFRTS